MSALGCRRRLSAYRAVRATAASATAARGTRTAPVPRGGPRLRRTLGGSSHYEPRSSSDSSVLRLAATCSQSRPSGPLCGPMKPSMACSSGPIGPAAYLLPYAQVMGSRPLGCHPHAAGAERPRSDQQGSANRRELWARSRGELVRSQVRHQKVHRRRPQLHVGRLMKRALLRAPP